VKRLGVAELFYLVRLIEVSLQMREQLPDAVSSTLSEDNEGGQTTSADRHLRRLYTPTLEEPWLRSLIRTFGETIRPPDLPPLLVTSKPIPVNEIWGLYSRDKKSNWMSLAIHATAVILLFTVASSKTVQLTAKRVAFLVAPDIAAYIPKMAEGRQPMGGGGGGGDRSPTPASKGRLPKPSMKQFTPPLAVVNNPNPKLVMDPAIIAPPDTMLPNVNLPNWGDPLAKIGPPSNGTGSGGGIGSGSGGGVGPGQGGGYGPGEGGGVGGGVFRVGGGVSAPVVLYKVEPEYSEEARKAKYAGTVVLELIVDVAGKAQNIKVTRSLGLGLDENAIQAVNQWKFRPGYRNGRPVPVIATIEVYFRLL
jgi:protein TonB